MKKENWEKELIDKQAEKLEKWGLRWNDDDWLDFIRQLFSQEKQEILKELEKIEVKVNTEVRESRLQAVSQIMNMCSGMGYNKALQEVKKIIEGI